MAPIRFLTCLSIVSSLVCCVPQQSARTDLKPPDVARAPARQVSEAPAPQRGNLTMIAPETVSPSNPAVATRGDIRTYVADLEHCKSSVSANIGATDRDNVAAIRRAMKDRPLDGKLTVHFEPGDAAMVRDQAVKKCLRGRGYAVNG